MFTKKIKSKTFLLDFMILELFPSKNKIEDYL
jgi:hypothetical protein